MLELNIRALTVLTHFFARRFRAQGSGTIMNVASTAAFQPNPYFALYGATKTYVLNLDEAINEELIGSNVRICTLCPGPTSTRRPDSFGSVNFASKGSGLRPPPSAPGAPVPPLPWGPWMRCLRPSRRPPPRPAVERFDACARARLV